jgi:hypothetical protein
MIRGCPQTETPQARTSGSAHRRLLLDIGSTGVMNRKHWGFVQVAPLDPRAQTLPLPGE